MSDQKKILVVDDNAANLTIINGILSTEYKVYPVDSSATALRFLETHSPDLMLLDVEMPDMNGIELFGIIRSDTRFSDIPIIFLTAHSSVENEAAAFKLGVSDYVRKPVNDAILLARVRLHIELASFRAGNERKV